MSDKEIKVYSDVPTGSSLVVRTPEEERVLALRMAGQLPPNQMEFHCRNCGKGGTLEFSQDEIDALDGDIRSYTGPCGGFRAGETGCGYMTLVPKDMFMGGETISAAARKQRLAEYREQADVLVDRVKAEVVSTFMPGMAPPPATAPTEPAPPGSQVENLPDADTVSIDDLKPR